MAKELSIRDAKIIFRNFQGKPNRFNPEGRRTFSVLLDDETAKMLEADGWNVKWRDSRDPEDPPYAHLPVVVNFLNFPPELVLIKPNGKQVITEAMVGSLDWADITSVNVIIRPYQWEFSGKTGVKAYVKKMYVKIAVDEFAQEYEDLPNIGPRDDE